MTKRYKFNQSVKSDLKYIPYTYLLVHKLSGKKYYGVRYCNSNAYNRSNPYELWKTYFSSCHVVHDLIERFGKDSFQYEVRKVFKTCSDALKWEIKVLQRMRVLERSDWINKSIPSLKFKAPSSHSEFTKNLMSEKRRGVQKTLEHRAKIGLANARRIVTEETKAKRRKIYEIIGPNGIIQTINNLQAFCIENDLIISQMYKVVSGSRNHHRGFKLKEMKNGNTIN